MTIGPLRAAASQGLQETDDSAVLERADEVASETIHGSELLRIVRYRDQIDHPLLLAGARTDRRLGHRRFHRVRTVVEQFDRAVGPPADHIALP